MPPTHRLILTLLVFATLVPLASSVLLILVGKRWMGKAAGWFATAVMAASLAACFAALVQWIGLDKPSTILWSVPWITIPASAAGWLYVGAMIDSLTIAMMALVAGISLLVHLYSVGYMRGDSRFERFFAYLSLFTFSMMGIVISHSLVMILIFWELVGLTSYLLIGFWFEKRGPQLACRKAFVMNRIGDMGFLIGFGILFYQLGGRVFLPAVEGIDGTVSMLGALTLPTAQGGLGIDILHPPMWLTAAGIGLFFGAVGKSAQFPLHTWLPDAMEGPTPVSSIVHSATMVAAGVYLTGRLYPILTPGAHLFIATIGLITLFIAACMAMVMTDIKRVLAYSTISQLGYMTLGLGAGAYAFALFHLITHAFFKCSLFQCAGSVIHAAHHQQDMRCYGGLWRKMPVTAIVYFVCLLAIAGASIPLTGVGISGFYSKDGILAGTVNFGHALSEHGWWAGRLFYIVPLAVAYMTVFYMGRSFAMTFLGQPRDAHLYEHAHEAPWTMLLPQAMLALLAVLAAPAVLPLLNLVNASTPAVAYVQPGVFAHHEGEPMYHGLHVVHAGLLQGFSWIIVLAAAVLLYQPGLKYAARIAALPGVNLLHRWALNKFYFDALYDLFVVGLFKALAGVVGAFDKYLVDGLVNLIGIVGKGLAYIVDWFDRRFVDGAVDGAATLAQNAGQLLRGTQVGRVRTYVLLLFASAVAAVIVVLLTVMT